MCRLLGVKRNSYYSYCKRQEEREPDPHHDEMLEAVKVIAATNTGRIAALQVNIFVFELCHSKKLIWFAGGCDLFLNFKKKIKGCCGRLNIFGNLRSQLAPFHASYLVFIKDRLV